jgi:2-polyprenyl-6-hydroxyphenyl methylase/3-demethylubiquinone-9 3-methyltransferase
VAEAYRRFFGDLDELAVLMAAWVPQAKKILEVGCGEGAMTERIVRTYPTATVTAIDVSPKAGRLYRGQTSTVTFSQESVANVARREPASFDLVVITDVIHHVPLAARGPLIDSIDQAMAPHGSLFLKDWVVSASPIHWMCYMSCRYLTGDDVVYCTKDGINALVAGAFGPGTVRRTGTTRPWANNVAVLVQRSEQPSAGETGNR